MKLTPIIAALRTRCSFFENRVAGAAQFKNLPDAGKMKLPAAYVIPGDDSPGEQKSQTDYWQTLKEGFAVIVFVSNSEHVPTRVFWIRAGTSDWRATLQPHAMFSRTCHRYFRKQF